MEAERGARHFCLPLRLGGCAFTSLAAKGRDLAKGLENPAVNAERIVVAFSAYMENDGHKVSRAQFEKNFAEKLRDPEFAADISPLLATGFAWNLEAAAPLVSSRLIERLPGDPWKGKR